MTYEETIKLDFELPPEMQGMQVQMPTAHTNKKLLYFNETASLLKNAPVDEENQATTIQGHDIHFTMDMTPPDDARYTDFTEGLVVEKKDFLGRTFLISGEEQNLTWRLSDERSEFLGYMTQKASAVQDSMTIEAWFTPEIPLPAGPAHFAGLPGLILVVNVNDGHTTYVAKEVTLEAVDTSIIKRPKKGKKVSREEFDQIVAEKTKEMQATHGGGNSVFIIQQ